MKTAEISAFAGMYFFAGKFWRIAKKLRKIKGGRNIGRCENGNYLSQNYIPPRNLTTAKML